MLATLVDETRAVYSTNATCLVRESHLLEIDGLEFEMRFVVVSHKGRKHLTGVTRC